MRDTLDEGDRIRVQIKHVPCAGQEIEQHKCAGMVASIDSL